MVMRPRLRNLDARIKNYASLSALKTAIPLKEEALQALEKQLIDAENANIQLKRRISELLQNSRNSKMSRHHTDPPEDLERMDSDELLSTVRNSTMQMSIDFITKGTTPDETRQSRELQYRVVNSAWILYRNLMGELDEALTQLGMELDENDAMQKEARASDELIGIMHNNFMRKQNKKRFWKTHYTACVGERNQYRNDKALLEYNRDRLYDRYLKWKQKTQAVRNENQNLNHQIIALQNNPPVIIQNQGMAGYAPKKFRGLPGEDPLLWFQEFRQWVEASGIDVGAGGANGVRNRARVLGVFETCMEDDARDWYESKIKGKNWELQNVLDGIGVATIRLFRAMNNGAIVALNANQFRGQASIVHGNAGAVNTITGHSFIPDETVWEEDWSIVGGRPTDLAPNAPNAGGGGTIVAPGLRAGQVFHEFKTAYTTITAEKSKVAFQSIVQGSGSITRFYSNLRRMVKLAYPTLPAINQEELVRQQFLQGLSRENQVEARRIGLENPTSAILKKLEEIERYRTDVSLPAPLLTPISNVQQGPSLDDIAKLIDSKIQPIKYTTPAYTPAHAPAPAPASAPKIVYLDDGRERMLMLAYRLGFPQPDNEGEVSVEVLENFIDKELRSRIAPDDYYHRTFQVKKVFGMNTSMYGYNTHADKPRKSSRKCSECGKSGHTKSSCPKKKKGKAKKKTNYVENDSTSESSSSDSSSSNDSDSDSHIYYGLKKKGRI